MTTKSNELFFQPYLETGLYNLLKKSPKGVKLLEIAAYTLKY